MAELILRSGKRAGRRIPLGNGETLIGRDENCRIRLTSSDISRQHCLLRCDGETVIATDLGSRNGTYVNDVPISAPTPLRPGDLLRVGPFLFQRPGTSDEPMSDDDISGWLTEEGTIAGERPTGVNNDTTLMDELDEQKNHGSTTEIPASAVSIEPPPVRKDPVVEQASAVIREYWASRKRRR
jgi:pSer/pThr/pTyr-binding forkhead associated (FHA) protein